MGDGLDDAASTGAAVEKVLENFHGAHARDDLANVEVGHGGLHGGAVLGGCADAG